MLRLECIKRYCPHSSNTYPSITQNPHCTCKAPCTWGQQDIYRHENPRKSPHMSSRRTRKRMLIWMGSQWRPTAHRVQLFWVDNRPPLFMVAFAYRFIPVQEVLSSQEETRNASLDDLMQHLQQLQSMLNKSSEIFGQQLNFHYIIVWYPHGIAIASLWYTLFKDGTYTV